LTLLEETLRSIKARCKNTTTKPVNKTKKANTTTKADADLGPAEKLRIPADDDRNPQKAGILAQIETFWFKKICILAATKLFCPKKSVFRLPQHCFARKIFFFGCRTVRELRKICFSAAAEPFCPRKSGFWAKKGHFDSKTPFRSLLMLRPGEFTHFLVFAALTVFTCVPHGSPASGGNYRFME
jgi:hypothetical protein